VNERPGVLSYIGSAVAALAAVGLAIRGEFPQAALLAAGAAFLIYWGRRLDREQGER
jgi:hypothetical protein